MALSSRRVKALCRNRRQVSEDRRMTSFQAPRAEQSETCGRPCSRRRRREACAHAAVVQDAVQIGRDARRGPIGGPTRLEPRRRDCRCPNYRRRLRRANLRIGGRAAPDRRDPIARFCSVSNRSPPPTSIAAATLTCIGPCGPLGSARHIPRRRHGSNSAPSTAKATRSSGLPGAGVAACGGFRSPAKVDAAINWLSKRRIAAAREQRMSRFRNGLTSARIACVSRWSTQDSVNL